MKVWIVFFLSVFPWTMYAQSEVNRRDGFLAIWDSIHRPAKEVYETPFLDIAEESAGFLQITYAKNRGLLEDQQLFRPEDPLTKQDAVFWLFRTRNVDDLEGMERADIPRLLERYPIIQSSESQELFGSMQELQELILQFDTLRNQEIHEVSYYADFFQGAGTAFGETFDMYALTAAHRTFPYNTLVRVTNLNNDKSIIVRINDRGPYVDGRSMDLSLAAFEAIGERSQGVLRRVRLERLGDADLLEADGLTENDSLELPAETMCLNEPKKRYQKRITRDVHFHRGIPHTLTLGDTLALGSTKFFVVQSILHPNGTATRMQDFVGKDERFSFSPSMSGTYTFYVGTGFGRGREMTMQVKECDL